MHVLVHFKYQYKNIINTVFYFRFISCPNKCNFLKSSVNVIDYVATISFYTDLFLQQHVSHIKNAACLSFSASSGFFVCLSLLAIPLA